MAAGEGAWLALLPLALVPGGAGAVASGLLQGEEGWGMGERGAGRCHARECRFAHEQMALRRMQHALRMHEAWNLAGLEAERAMHARCIPPCAPGGFSPGPPAPATGGPPPRQAGKASHNEQACAARARGHGVNR